MTSLLPLDALNEASESEFVDALKPLFEAAGPLGAALYARRPFGSYAELLDNAAVAGQRLSGPQQVEVVNAHPRIGENPARLSELSYREQGYAAPGSTECAEVLQQLRELNEEYERRFGFRFVVFVNGRPKAAIVEVMRERLGRAPDDELRTALSEMLAIARDRLRTLS
jgi:2-oxo-4-hydroxy-4-carboxy-5-ureidoimidazoline decarboxylase